MRRIVAPGIVSLVALAMLALASCARVHPTASEPGYSGVGYVRVDDAIRSHPLYPQIVQYDEEIAVLEGQGVPPAPVDPAEMKRREAALQRDLAAAAANAKAELARLRQHYQAEEGAAVAAALQSAGMHAPANAGAGVTASVASTFQAQAQAVDERAQQSFDAYRAQVTAQARAQLDAAAKRFSEEADRKYRGKVRDLESAEAQLAQQLAEKSAPQRLELRTKLQNLALNDAQRTQLESQLKALDGADADQVAQMRNRDQQTLQAYRAQLRSEVQTQMATVAAQVHRDTDAKLQQRAGAERLAVQQQIRALAPRVGEQLTGFDVSQLPPDLRARVEQIHADFEHRYERDAQAALARFNKTRASLAQRDAALHGAIGAADAQTAKEVSLLRAERSDLYRKIVAQIDQTARAIGRKRGLKVVIGGAVAGGAGVDLTPEVVRALRGSHA